MCERDADRHVLYQLLLSSGSPAAQVGALAGASLAFFAWNTSTMAAAVSSSQGLRFRTVYTKGLLLCLLVWFGNTSVGVLLVVLAQSQPVMLLVVPVLLVLLYFVYWSYLRAMHERDMWQVLQATSRQLVRVEPGEVASIVMASAPAAVRGGVRRTAARGQRHRLRGHRLPLRRGR